MTTYWFAKKKDGTTVTELTHRWSEVKDDVVSLCLNLGDSEIYLPENMEKYIEAKTASVGLGGGEPRIESRYIGFKLGNNVVRVRVSEKNNDISVEVDPV